MTKERKTREEERGRKGKRKREGRDKLEGVGGIVYAESNIRSPIGHSHLQPEEKNCL